MDAEYGLRLDVRGRRTIAFLPEPRVKFEDVAVTSRDRALVAEGRLAEADLPEGVAELIVREGLYGAAAREASA